MVLLCVVIVGCIVVFNGCVLFSVWLLLLGLYVFIVLLLLYVCVIDVLCLLWVFVALFGDYVARAIGGHICDLVVVRRILCAFDMLLYISYNDTITTTHFQTHKNKIK